MSTTIADCSDFSQKSGNTTNHIQGALSRGIQYTILGTKIFHAPLVFLYLDLRLVVTGFSTAYALSSNSVSFSMMACCK